MCYIFRNLTLFVFLCVMPLKSFSSMQCIYLHGHSYAKQLSCLKSDFVAADMLLNDADALLMAKVAGVPANQALLKTAQKSWIKFRDDDCKFGSLAHIGPGSHQSVSVMSCMLERTKERSEQIKNMINCPRHYFFCPTN